MTFDFTALNWKAILLCVVLGQMILTVWFAVLVAEPWAKVYGAADKAQHAAEIPMYTYGVGLICMFALAIGLALLRQALGVAGISGGFTMGLFVSLAFCLATAVPGYAFLGMWTGLALAIAPQMIVILVHSTVLSTWI